MINRNAGSALKWVLILCAAACGMATPLRAQPATQSARDLLVVDKDFNAAAQLQRYGATASLSERDGKMNLEVVFHPGANSYPGVTLPAPGGKWDLSTYNRVVFDIANSGDAPVRLGCRVMDGPVTDGHRHCNTEMLSLKPGEARSVTVIFGRSYGGNVGWKLDRGHVTGVAVYAEKPAAPATITLQRIAAYGGALPGQLRTAASDQWQPIQSHLVPDKGSALDFSFLLDAPAGKHGRVVIRNGHLEFQDQPGHPIRFYGTNTVYGANFPDKQTAVIMADQLARAGYNSVRLHHFDELLLDKNARDSVTFDPLQLDRLDYFFACLKERGIYLSIDLYSTRQTRPGEIPDLHGAAMMGKFKSAVYILDSARKNWETYSRRLLTHVNPYTQLAWKDDPALYALSLINEGQVYQSWRANASLYEQRFELYNRTAAATQNADQKAAAWNWFLTDIQRKWTKRATAFVWGLGTDVLITDANYISMKPLSIFRTDLELIDIHCYWDGPQALHGWGAPLRCGQGNLVKDGGVHMPLYSIAGRLIGKPFMITEFNVGYPNRYRSTCGPMVGALSAFQGIDAVYRFDHIGTPLNKPGPIIWFSSGNDPIALLGDRIGAAIFLRGDVHPATTFIPYLVTDDYLNKPKALDWSHWYPDRYIALGTRFGLGTIVLEKDATLKTPARYVISAEAVPQQRLGETILVHPDQCGTLEATIKKDHPEMLPPAPAQIHLDRQQGTLRIVGDRSECLVVPDGFARLEGKFLTAENAVSHETVAAIALDDQPLASSRRILIVQMTNIVNEGELYQDKSMQVLEKYGGPGLLVQGGSVRLTLHGVDDAARLYALDLAGRRLGKVVLQFAHGDASFVAQTQRQQGACLAYELVRSSSAPAGQ